MTSNPVAHVEIPVANLSRACRFYERVFGTSLVITEIDGNMMALFPHAEGAPGASVALACGASYTPAAAGARVYFAVDDIQATLARAVGEGAVIHYPLTEVPGYGWVAEFIDSEGNCIALHADLAPQL